jgi:Fic family protein
LAEAGEPVREVDLREIHRLVMVRVDPEEAGRYSIPQRMIAGSPLVLPMPVEIPALMAEFAAWLAMAPAGPETGFAAHARLVAIHPFSDGNGRTARLLMKSIASPGRLPAARHRARASRRLYRCFAVAAAGRRSGAPTAIP